MKYVSAFIGAMILGTMTYGIWPEMWMSYGIVGGWLSATILIGTGWYMCHWLEIIPNRDGGVWVDMGFAIGAAGISWSMVRFYPDCEFTKAIPTFVFCVIGGGLAGVVAALVKKSNRKFQ